MNEDLSAFFITCPADVFPDVIGAPTVSMAITDWSHGGYSESGHDETEALLNVAGNGCIVSRDNYAASELIGYLNPIKRDGGFERFGMTHGRWSDAVVEYCLASIPRHLVDSELVPPGKEPERIPVNDDRRMDEWCEKYVEGIPYE